MDAWVLVHWILGSLIPAVDQWNLLASERLYGATENSFTRKNRITEHADSLEFVRGITTSMTSSLSVWTQTFIGSRASDAGVQQSRLIISVVSRSLKLSMTHPSRYSLVAVTSAVGKQTYEWACFLNQSKVTTYYDDTEQIGVRLGDAEAQVECGEEIWPLDETFINTPLAKGTRWSYYGSHPIKYLSGPISLINHACRRHFNVSLQKMRDTKWRFHAFRGRHADIMVAVAERRIEAGDKFYAVYDDDEDSLLVSRGITCLKCVKIK